MNARGSLNVAVQRPKDAALIRAMVGRDVSSRMRMFAAQGRVSLATVGRNPLIHEGGSVLLVMDSDTRNRRMVEEMRSMARVAMSGVASAGVGGGLASVGVAGFPSPPPFDVFVFVPAIEVVFFEALDLLKALLGESVTEERLREGRLSPEETLSELLRESGKFPNYDALVSAASEPEAAEALASGNQASELVTLIKRMASEPVPS